MRLIQRIVVPPDLAYPPKVDSWTSNGEPVQVITEKSRDETEQEWCAAHDAAVAAAKELWPPDPR